MNEDYIKTWKPQTILLFRLLLPPPPRLFLLYFCLL